MATNENPCFATVPGAQPTAEDSPRRLPIPLPLALSPYMKFFQK